MDVRITSRHESLSDGFLERAEERARKMAKYEPRLQAVELVFREDHGKVRVEARGEVPGLPPLVTRSEASTHRTALDGALEKLRRRLRRERTKRIEHQGPPAAAVPEEIRTP